MSQMALDEAFTALVAGFNRSVPCDGTTKSGSPCGRPANWHVNLHGCESGTLCGHHFHEWERANLTSLRRDGALKHSRCGGRWTVGRGGCWTAVRI